MQETSNSSESNLICRFCLVSNDSLHSIFKHETIDIPAIVKIVTNLVVSESDSFSKHICIKCIDIVECIVQFRKRCHESYHAAERKLLSQDESSLYKVTPSKGTIQVEFIKCESPGIADTIGYEQEETFSDLTDSSEQEYDGKRKKVGIQTSDEQFRNDNNQLAVKAAEHRTVNSTKNVPIQSIEPKPNFLPEHTRRGKIPKDLNSYEEHAHQHTLSDQQNDQIQSHRIDSSHLHHQKINKRLNTTDTCKPETYECEVCGKKLKTKSNYTNHRKMHNRKAETGTQKNIPDVRGVSEQKRVYLCNICGHNCGSSSNLGVHLRRHNGQSVCECTVCGKGFPRRSDLVMHMRKHTGEKPFICPTCGRGFSRLDKLRIHIRTHTGEKPYNCPCGRAYAQRNDLKSHQKRNICGQNFDVAKLLAPRPTTICIKSPQRQAQSTSSSQLQNDELEQNLNSIPPSYSTSGDSSSGGLNLVPDPMADMVFPSSWNNCISTHQHFQHHERTAADSYEGSSSYVHQTKLIT